MSSQINVEKLCGRRIRFLSRDHDQRMFHDFGFTFGASCYDVYIRDGEGIMEKRMK